MAKAYGLTHKCAIEVGGKPMLTRVVETLRACSRIGEITVAMESEAQCTSILGSLSEHVRFIPSRTSAARSAAAAVQAFPTLVTTGDHPLLTVEMLDAFLSRTEQSAADLTVGLATAETILAEFPNAQRTFLKFGPDRVSGCNLFGLRTEAATRALDFWHYLEPVRKKPWRLVSAFGPVALFRFLTGAINLKAAFEIASRRLHLKALPVLLPYAEAAVDVDKPADKELAESIMQRRATMSPPAFAPAADRPENRPRTK
jgi:GTP:adenosylcobinamide-phosphate guanylyltransferase